MHEDLLKEQHLEAMRQLGNSQTPGMGNIQPPRIGNAHFSAPVDLSPLHGPNYRNLPAVLEGRDRVIIAEICEHIGIRYSRAEAVRIGRELRARGWRPALWRVNGKIVSGFHRPGALRPRQVAPPAVGFWRRLANLLTGGDR